jgi:adenylyl-sulfate kinase
MIDREARRRRNSHGGAVVWLTGLPASGKSTIAGALEDVLFARGAQVHVLDGDELRRGLCRDLGFSPEDRRENVRRAGEVAALLAGAGLIAVAAFISPHRHGRAQARAAAAPLPFVEVFVDCPLAECIRRDPKGLYRRALAGELMDFTGVSSLYEAPEHPDLHLRTDGLPVFVGAERIVHHLEELGVLCV